MKARQHHVENPANSIKEMAAAQGWTDATLLALLLDILDDEEWGSVADSIVHSVQRRTEEA